LLKVQNSINENIKAVQHRDYESVYTESNANVTAV